MRRLPIVFAAAVAAGLWGGPADVNYVEGDANLRRADGRVAAAEIGDVLTTGDGVRTGADGAVELDQDGVVIRVASDTVFTLMERSGGQGATPVLSVALGSLRMRFERITGREPLIRTNGATAGVRGTELTVWSGADGSTLIAVESGLVTVESEGVAVDLAANEAVEVPLGRPPGQKIAIQRDQVDYRTWNQGKLESLLADPVAGIGYARRTLDGYVQAIAQSVALYGETRARLEDERRTRARIATEKSAEEAATYEADVVQPLVRETSPHFLNLRYNALAALSLRRFVAGRLYVMLKPRLMTAPPDAALSRFLDDYRDMLNLFETTVAPHLVDADI